MSVVNQPIEYAVGQPAIYLFVQSRFWNVRPWEGRGLSSFLGVLEVMNLPRKDFASKQPAKGGDLVYTHSYYGRPELSL
jgi:hypothetical protein